MTNIRALLRTWGPSLLMMATIFCFSSIPGKEMPSFGLIDTLVKKGGHATGYALLALANLWGLRAGRSAEPAGVRGARDYLWAWLIALAFAAMDEFHQSFIAGRHPAVTDVGIDGLGAIFGLALAAWYRRKTAESDRD